MQEILGDGGPKAPSVEGLEAPTWAQKAMAKAARRLRQGGGEELLAALNEGDGKALRRLAISGRSAEHAGQGARRGETLMWTLAQRRDEFGLAALRFLLDVGALDPRRAELATLSRSRSMLSIALENGAFENALEMLWRMKQLPPEDGDGIGPVAAAAKGAAARLSSMKWPSFGQPRERDADALSQFEQALKLLAALGADVNQKMASDFLRIEGGKGSTALRWAAPWPALIEALLRHGADPNAADEQGRTPLMWAAAALRRPDGDPQALRMLLDAGADAKALDAEGLGPLGWMASRKMDGVMANFQKSMLADIEPDKGMRAAAMLIEAGASGCLAGARWVGQDEGAGAPPWMGAIAAALEAARLGEVSGVAEPKKGPRL